MTFKNYKKFIKKRKFILKESTHQCYGHVTDILGNGRFLVACSDGHYRVCLLRGRYRNKLFQNNNTLRKYFWIEKGDFVLICIRSYQEIKGDIIFKYTPEEEEYIRDLEEEEIIIVISITLE